jgi:hypothetical protein
MPNIDRVEARKYLEKIGPFITGGYVNIYHGKYNPTTEKLDFFTGNAHTSIDTILNDLQYWVNRGFETYMCLSASPKIMKEDKPYPKAYRKSGTELGMRSLWLELDVGNGKYSSASNADKALLKFLIDAKLLTPSMIVKSGSGGMHVYWACDSMIKPQEFNILSKALTRTGKKYGLIFDSQCTVDHVRIFRPPGTFNFKYGREDKVKLHFDSNKNYTLKQLQEMLEVTIDSDPPPNETIQTPKSEYPPADIDQVAKACPFIAKTLEMGGTNHNKEVLWTYTIMLSTYCVDPEETSIRFSNKHPTFREQDVMDKLKYHMEDHKNNSEIGPPKCESFHREGAAECGTCPYLKLGRSPLNIPGASTPSATIQLNDLPPGYYRGKDQHIFGTVRKKVGEIWVDEAVKVFPYQIRYGSGWVEPNCQDYHFNFLTNEEGTKEKAIILPFTSAYSDDKLKLTLAAHGLPLPRYNRETREFFVAYQEMLRSRAGGIVRDEPIGWTMTNGEFAGFSYDGQFFSPNVHHVVPKLKGALLQNYTPMGSSQPWLELSQIITEQHRPALNILLLTGFASPLVAMTGHSGIILGGYSPETGIGKSTCMETTTSIWGHPINSRCGLNDTINMAVNKAGQIKHLPLVWDEVKTRQQFSNLTNIVFQMTEGREKGRLDRNAVTKDMKDFQTLLVYAANASVIEAILESTKGTSAGYVRDFEFRVPDTTSKSNHTIIEVQNLINKLKTNHGMIGLAYAKYLGENGKTIHSDVVELQKALEAKFNATNDERFWLSGMAVILSAAKIAKEQKWVDVDAVELYKFLHQEFHRMRNKKAKAPTDYTQERGIVWLLSQYLSEKRSANMVIINKFIEKGRGKIGEVEVEGRGTSKDNLLRQIDVVIARETKTLKFTDSSWLHFCKARDIPTELTRLGLKDILGAAKVSGRITAGTGYPCGPEPCWVLNLTGTQFEGMFEI